MNPFRAFYDYTKNFSFMEKLVAVLLVMIFVQNVYDKLWGDSNKQEANHKTHTMFWSKLDEVRADNKEFHDKALELQEKSNDRLFDLLTVGKRTAAATEKIPQAAAKAAEKLVEEKKASEKEQ